jgi:hypothetical protein
MASGWPGKGHVSLLKKSLSDRSIDRIASIRSKNTAKTLQKLWRRVLDQGSEGSMEEFFNRLNPSTHSSE